jgi:hypothetical protein
MGGLRSMDRSFRNSRVASSCTCEPRSKAFSVRAGDREPRSKAVRHRCENLSRVASSCTCEPRKPVNTPVTVLYLKLCPVLQLQCSLASAKITYLGKCQK